MAAVATAAGDWREGAAIERDWRWEEELDMPTVDWDGFVAAVAEDLLRSSNTVLDILPYQAERSRTRWTADRDRRPFDRDVVEDSRDRHGRRGVEEATRACTHTVSTVSRMPIDRSRQRQGLWKSDSTNLRWMLAGSAPRITLDTTPSLHRCVTSYLLHLVLILLVSI